MKVSFNTLLVTDSRVSTLWDCRNAILCNRSVVTVPVKWRTFFAEYAAAVRSSSFIDVSDYELETTPYTKDSVVWYSGGSESVYMAKHTSEAYLVSMGFADAPAEVDSRHKREFQLFLASYALGFRNFSIGISDAVLQWTDKADPFCYEHSLDFVALWNANVPFQANYPVARISKAAIYAGLSDTEIKRLQYCEQTKNSYPCRECWKCFEYFHLYLHRFGSTPFYMPNLEERLFELRPAIENPSLDFRGIASTLRELGYV